MWQDQFDITWQECAELPIEVNSGQATVLDDKVYYGGGETNDVDNTAALLVYSYDPSQDNWTTLPPLPVMWFGLGQVNGKLVAVGGRNRGNMRWTDKVYTYDERSKKWEQKIPPMPRFRHSPGVLSLQSALVVACGVVKTYTDAVEIFKADTSQWYTTDPLPKACYDISLVAIGNTCYALGGYRSPARLKQALYASVDDLLHNAVPANQTTHSGSNDTQSAWKTLPDTPTYRPAAAVLAGHLLAVGGMDTSILNTGSGKKEVYTYSPSTDSWIYISDLPAPRSVTAVVQLSSMEVLVIGGNLHCDDDRVKSVYKAILCENND